MRHLIRGIACVLLGALTAAGVAIFGAILGGDQTTNAASPFAAAVSALDSEAVVFRRYAWSWCIEVTTMLRIVPISLDADAVNIDSPHVQQRRIRRAAALPGSCHPPEGAANARTEYHIGWPWACLWGAEDGALSVDRGTMAGTVHIMCVSPFPDSFGAHPPVRDILDQPFARSPISDRRYVPTGVLPLGAALDGAVFAIGPLKNGGEEQGA